MVPESLDFPKILEIESNEMATAYDSALSSFHTAKSFLYIQFRRLANNSDKFSIAYPKNRTEKNFCKRTDYKNTSLTGFIRYLVLTISSILLLLVLTTSRIRLKEQTF